MEKVEHRFGVPVLGIESNPDRARGASRIWLRNLADLSGLPDSADTFIVSLRRFEEIPALEKWCLDHARQVLVYSYDSPMFASFL
jgi:hypothetical protein